MPSGYARITVDAFETDSVIRAGVAGSAATPSVLPGITAWAPRSAGVYVTGVKRDSTSQLQSGHVADPARNHFRRQLGFQNKSTIINKMETKDVDYNVHWSVRNFGEEDILHIRPAFVSFSTVKNYSRNVWYAPLEK
jgi:hypothetical protein